MKNNFETNEISLWSYFNEYAENKGYEVWAHSDSVMGRGTTVYSNDTFKPIFKFAMFGVPSLHYDFCILVEDRNGNSMLNGNTCGVYSLQALPDTNFAELKERFEKMIEYVFSKYEIYSKKNRFDFTFNGLSEERIKF